MKKNIKTIIWILIAFILVLLLIYSFKKPVEKVNPVIYTVSKNNMELSYTGDGKVESEKVMAVYSTTSGKVKNVYYRLWDNVKKGQVLLDIDKSSIDDLENNIKISAVKLKDLEEKVELNQKLYDNGLVAKNTLENLKTQLELAKLDNERLLNNKSKVELLVKAPISGVIIELNADDNYTIDLSKPLFKIADTDNLKVVLSLPNDKVKNLKVGDKVYVTSTSLPQNKVLNGHIISIDKISYVDNQYRDSTTNINIKLDNNYTLKPGDLVDIKIVYENIKDQLIIPANYILTDKNGQPYVLKLNKDNKLEKVNIVLGANDSINYVVLKGLQLGDKIINNSTLQFKEGDVINDNSKQSK